MSKKIFFLAENDGNAKMCLSIAKNIKILKPEIDLSLIDVSQCYENCISGAAIFEKAGFKSIRVSFINNNNSNLDLNFAEYFYALFKREQPLAIIIPHELGYAAIAVNISHEMGILSMHYQHGDLDPDYYDEITEEGIYPRKYKFQCILSLKNGKLRTFLTLQNKICSDELNLIYCVLIAIKKLIAHNFDYFLYLIHIKFGTIKGKNKGKPNTSKFINVEKRSCILADYVAVNGDYWKQNLTNRGISEDKIIVTGNLRTDQFFNQPLSDYTTLCQHYGLNPKLPLIIYFYSPVEESCYLYPLAYDPIEAIHDVITAIRTANPDYNILILNHPRRKLNTLNSIIELGISTLKVGYTENNFWSLCNHSDLIIGTISSAMNESLLARKPIITQNYIFKNKGSSLLSEYNAAISVFHKIHLNQQIKRAIFDKKFRENLIENQKIASYELMGQFDGKCGERFARSLLQIVENHEKKGDY